MRKQLVLCVACLALIPGAARARGSAADPPPVEPVAPQSIGFPNRGSLAGGVELKPSHTIVTHGAHVWGLPALIAMIEYAASRVAGAHEGAVLVVGDLSARDGGPIKGHDSHESGRDVDLSFYLLRGDDDYLAEEHLVIEPDGRARKNKGVRFDDARNWLLVEALLAFDGATVQQIFVANHLRKRLLAEGRRSGAAKATMLRAASVMCQPKKAQPHDDHFHVRIRCPKGNRKCVHGPASKWASKVAPRPKKKASSPLTHVRGAGAENPRRSMIPAPRRQGR
jgi:penicillin-insensitive murein endopeptidase